MSSFWRHLDRIVDYLFLIRSEWLFFQLEFPDYPPLLRQAVSLGRLLLDPLVEYAHLCNTDDDILCVSYHPLQGEVNKVRFCI